MKDSGKRAVVYARVSDRQQAENDVSIPAQIDAANRRAADLGATVAKVFADEGRSAFKAGNRPAFEAAIEFATTTGCDYFITWSSARFARNRFEAIMYKGELDRAGTELVYLDIEVDRKTDAGWMMDGMLELFDEMKSRQTAVDTKRSLMRNAEMGYYTGGPTPYGYVSVPAPDNPKRRKLVPLPEEAARIVEIFNLRLQGLGAKSIAVRYNSMGVRYRGRTWKKDTVLHILRSQAVVGRSVFNRVDRRTGKERPQDEWVVVDSHEPVVSPAVWAEVQASMDAAATNAGARGSSLSSQPFSGILRCAKCGGALIVETATGRGGLYRYFRCRRAREDNACDGQRWPAEKLNDFLQDIVFARILDRASLAEMATELTGMFGEWEREQRAKRKGLAAQATAIKQRNSKLFEVLEAMGRDAPNLGDLTQRLRDNNAELKALETQLAELDAAEPPAHMIEMPDLDDLAQDIRSIFTESGSAARLRAFYQSFISEVIVGATEAEIHYIPSAVIATGGNAVHRFQKWGG